MRKRLLIIGTVFLFISFFLMTVGLVSQNVRADGAAGRWEGTCTRTTHVSTYRYDVVLELSGGSSVSGTITLTCTGYNGGSGWVSPEGIGDPQTTDVDGTVSGSELTLQMNIYTLTLEISGDTMTGGGQGTDAYNTPSTWSFNLRNTGSFGLSSLAVPSAFIGFLGGVFGLAAAFSHAPYELERPRSAPVQQENPQTNPEPPPSASIDAPALSDPLKSAKCPLQPLGSTTGGHMVPWDAPRQYGPEEYPDNYPYPKGTSVNVRCEYCGQNTLSPFMTGWFCTNALCPARREKIMKGYTHHEYNNMTWRRL